MPSATCFRNARGSAAFAPVASLESHRMEGHGVAAGVSPRTPCPPPEPISWVHQASFRVTPPRSLVSQSNPAADVRASLSRASPRMSEGLPDAALNSTAHSPSRSILLQRSASSSCVIDASQSCASSLNRSASIPVLPLLLCQKEEDKVAAFRYVAYNFDASLEGLLRKYQRSEWSKWTNEAGETLFALSSRTGSKCCRILQSDEAALYLPIKIKGVRVLVEQGCGLWRTDNSLLNADEPGIAYRKSADDGDRSATWITWGTIFRGCDVGDDWVRCAHTDEPCGADTCDGSGDNTRQQPATPTMAAIPSRVEDVARGAPRSGAGASRASELSRSRRMLMSPQSASVTVAGASVRPVTPPRSTSEHLIQKPVSMNQDTAVDVLEKHTLTLTNRVPHIEVVAEEQVVEVPERITVRRPQFDHTTSSQCVEKKVPRTTIHEVLRPVFVKAEEVSEKSKLVEVPVCVQPSKAVTDEPVLQVDGRVLPRHNIDLQVDHRTVEVPTVMEMPAISVMKSTETIEAVPHPVVTVNHINRHDRLIEVPQTCMVEKDVNVPIIKRAREADFVLKQALARPLLESSSVALELRTDMISTKMELDLVKGDITQLKRDLEERTQEINELDAMKRKERAEVARLSAILKRTRPTSPARITRSPRSVPFEMGAREFTSKAIGSMSTAVPSKTTTASMEFPSEVDAVSSDATTISQHPPDWL